MDYENEEDSVFFVFKVLVVEERSLMYKLEIEVKIDNGLCYYIVISRVFCKYRERRD